MQNDWANSFDLHLEPDPGVGRREGLERALRDAIRDGRLVSGERLPSSRALAAELGLARNTVSAAYDQLVAEGFLMARTGSGTQVADIPRPDAVAPDSSVDSAKPRYDLRPGSPDVTTFPVNAWLKAMRKALSTAPWNAYEYGDSRGRRELRSTLTDYLGRTRGVLTSPDRMVIATGYVQALGLIAKAIGSGTVAMEDPGLDVHREVVRRAGLSVVPLPVDGRGARTDLLSTMDVRAVVLTPAHQFPRGVTLQPDRRHALAQWARATGGFVVEDDYDGEFRYDRQPVGSLQGMAPDHVVYVGTASKTLGPALRLAWMAVPGRLLDGVVDAKRYNDRHSEIFGQLALAELIDSHAYDRHVRAARLRYRHRRDLLVKRLGHHRVSGISAGLHALIEVADERAVLAAAAAQSLAVGSLAEYWQRPNGTPGIIVGFGTPPDHLYGAALDVLARVLRAT